MDGKEPLYLWIWFLYVVGALWLTAVLGFSVFLLRDYVRDRRRRS
jgi:hypothetical protein